MFARTVTLRRASVGMPLRGMRKPLALLRLPTPGET